MATRLFFTNGAPGFTPTTIRGTWTTTTSAITGKLGAAPAGVAATRAATKSSATSGANTLWGRWISDPIAQSGTLSGVVNWVLGVVESISTANGFFRLHIYVTSGSADVVRGTLLSNYTGTTEFGTTAAGLGQHDIAISSLAVTAGDRIVVEIGWQGVNTSTTTSATMNYGNTGITGVRIGTTDQTVQPGWIQFSDPAGVIAGTSFTGLRRNYCVNPAAAVDISYWAAADASVARVTGLSGYSRTTGCRATITTAPNPILNTPRQIVSVGESWMAYLEYRCNSAARNGDIYIGYLDAAGSYVDFVDTVITTYPTTATALWFDLRTAPANTVDFLMSIEANNGVLNDQFDVTCCYYDQRAPATDYRDGGDADWTWLGTAGSSQSQQRPFVKPSRPLAQYRR